MKKRIADWVPLGEGDIDWTAIYQALKDIGYSGTATVELGRADAAGLKEIRRRFNLILTGQLTPAKA